METTTSFAFSPPTLAAAAIGSPRRRSVVVTINHITRLNSFCGLKAQNNMISLGQAVCTQRSFAKFMSSLKVPSRGGGALSSTCNAVGGIFRIATIMNVLTLVGFVVGFVLLRIEATVEEAKAD